MKDNEDERQLVLLLLFSFIFQGFAVNESISEVHSKIPFSNFYLVSCYFTKELERTYLKVKGWSILKWLVKCSKLFDQGPILQTESWQFFSKAGIPR